MKSPPRLHPVHRLLLLFAALGSSCLLYADAQTWVDLVDDDLSHWRGYRMTTVPDGWQVVDGAITRLFEPGQDHAEFVEGGGDLMTRRKYENFVLEFEYNIVEGGNSGVMYMVQETSSRPYWTGPEFQVMERPDRKSNPPFHFSGANYALQGPAQDIAFPPGNWNTARIVVDGPHVQHWLNGILAVEYLHGSNAWLSQVATSKFIEYPEYAAIRKGHIVLQDHGSIVRYRNVRIKELGGEHSTPSTFDARGTGEWWSLFNGKNLDGWHRWLGIPHPTVRGLDLPKNNAGEYTAPLGLENDPRNVFTVVEEDCEPAIRISGEIYGALTSLFEYDNFHLRLEVKWGTLKWEPRLDKARNSGLIYYGTGERGAAFDLRDFMIAPECQIRHGDFGDFIMFPGTRAMATSKPGEDFARIYDPNGSLEVVDFDGEFGFRVIKSADFERPLGEWNRVEIMCVNGEAIHIVNGEIVARGSSMVRIIDGEEIPLRRGKIQIQSEGAEVFYRNIELRLISELPEQ